jgi:hypothetical protein
MLSAPQIQEAFDALSKELEAKGRVGEIVVVGGAALVLLFGARETTKDVDALFLHPEAADIRAAVTRVAALLDLPEDWLNDAAKGFMVGVTTGEEVHRSAGLLVTTASVEQLLAMKLAAWRDAIDRADARLLLENLAGITHADLWARLEPLIPPPQLDKASYAFQDLWESVHGSS